MTVQTDSLTAQALPVSGSDLPTGARGQLPAAASAIADEPHKLKGGRPLLVGADPKPDESLKGYLLRLTELNGYDKVSRILRLAGALSVEIGGRYSAQRIARSIERLAPLARTTPSALRNIAYLPPEKQRNGLLQSNGKAIQLYALDLHQPKICPRCLKEDLYLRRCWDLTMMTVCPDHGIELTDTCPKCHIKLSWRRAKVAICECGYDLKGAPVRYVDGALLDISSVLANRFKNRGPFLGVSKIAPAIKSMDPFDLLATIFFLGGQSVKTIDTSGRFARDMPLAARRLMMKHVGMAASDWPFGFFDYLDGMFGGREAARGTLGLRKYFGSFYVVMYEPRHDRHFQLLREGTEQYLVDRLDGSVATRRGQPTAFREHSDPPRYITKEEAKMWMSCSGATIDRLIKLGTLESETLRAGKITVKKISAESVDRYLERCRNWLSGKKVAEVLGVSKRTAIALANSGHIQLVAGPEVDGSRVRMFSRESVAELEKRLHHHLPVLPKDIGGTEYMWFGEVAILMRFHGLSVTDLVQKIIKRKITPFFQSETGGILGSLAFPMKAITDLYDDGDGSNAFDVIYKSRISHRRRPKGTPKIY